MDMFAPQTSSHADMGSPATTPTCDEHEQLTYSQNSDSLFLIAFALRSPFRPASQPSSARSSFDSSDSDDLRYSLFSSDEEEDEDEASTPTSARSSHLPVWPEELQYPDEEPSSYDCHFNYPTSPLSKSLNQAPCNTPSPISPVALRVRPTSYHPHYSPATEDGLRTALGPRRNSMRGKSSWGTVRRWLFSRKSM